MVLDKKFNLVLTKSTQADRSHFTAMEISVKKVPAKLNRQKRINTYCSNGFEYYISSSYVKQEQKRNGSRCYLQWL